MPCSSIFFNQQLCLYSSAIQMGHYNVVIIHLISRIITLVYFYQDGNKFSVPKFHKDQGNDASERLAAYGRSRF